MKMKKALPLLLTGCLLAALSGCRDSDDTKASDDTPKQEEAEDTEKDGVQLPDSGTIAEDTADDTEVPPSDEQPSTAPDGTGDADSGQEISSVPETTGQAEGSSSLPLSEFSDADEYKVGDTITFEDEDISYTFTVTDVEFTDGRDEHAANQPDQVVLISYKYEPLSGSALLIDDMSFQLFLPDGTACGVYYFPELETPSLVSAPDTCSAQIAYGVPEGTDSAVLCYRDSSHRELPEVKLLLDLS